MTPEQHASQKLRAAASYLDSGGRLLEVSDDVIAGNIWTIKVVYRPPEEKPLPALGFSGESMAGWEGDNSSCK